MKQAPHPRRSVRARSFVLGLATAGLSALASQAVHAASANWNAAPTNGIWEAAGAENNWSTGAGTFPGTTAVGSITNADVATFNAVSSVTTISVDATVPN